MTGHSVELTDVALSAIREQARYIAVDAQAPLNAERCLARIWDAVATAALARVSSRPTKASLGVTARRSDC